MATHARVRAGPPTLRSRVSEQLAAYSQWAELPETRRAELRDVFELLTDRALDRRDRPPFPGLSRINADGLPFQWSLCVGAGDRSVRFLCEAGVPGSSVPERAALSLRRLEEACERLGHARPRSLHETVLPHVLPRAGQWPAHWRGAIWFGVGAGVKGVALKPYFNLNHGAPIEGWKRVGWVLRALGRLEDLACFCGLSGRVSKDSWPVGLAVDLLPDGGVGRVKIYFRSAAVRPDWLARWYEAVGAASEAPAVRGLLDAFPWPGRAPYPDRAFILSLEFHPSAPRPSLKTDVAVTRWMRSDREAVLGTLRLLGNLGLGEFDYLSGLRTLGALPPDEGSCAVHRFVGLGFEPDGARHVNVYLEPALSHPRVAPRRREAVDEAHALKRGLDFLVGARREGRWSDFELPVGVADAWVTAYTLYQLGSVARQDLGPGARAAVATGLDWLERHRSPGGGWGYHAGIDSDADSTALAVLALRRHGRSPPAEALRAIERCMRDDGGAATYPEDYAVGGAWTRGVCDVTPFALRALGPRLSTDEAIRTASFLAARQRLDGLWPSYWWLTPLYPTWGVLECLGARGPIPRSWALMESLRRWRPVDAFEAALLILCLARLPDFPRWSHLASRLAEEQRPDGSWDAAPKLRLTRPEISEPWTTIDAGPVFTDEGRIFTTATAIAALAAALAPARAAPGYIPIAIRPRPVGA